MVILVLKEVGFQDIKTRFGSLFRPLSEPLIHRLSLKPVASAQRRRDASVYTPGEQLQQRIVASMPSLRGRAI